MEVWTPKARVERSKLGQARVYSESVGEQNDGRKEKRDKLVIIVIALHR